MELVDMLVLGTSAEGMRVRVPRRAIKKKSKIQESLKKMIRKVNVTNFFKVDFFFFL